MSYFKANAQNSISALHPAGRAYGPPPDPLAGFQ